MRISACTHLSWSIPSVFSIARGALSKSTRLGEELSPCLGKQERRKEKKEENELVEDRIRLYIQLSFISCDGVYKGMADLIMAISAKMPTNWE